MVIASKQYCGPCSCQQTHHVQTMLMVIESNVLHRFSDYCGQIFPGRYLVAVYDENTYRATEAKHPLTDHTVVLNPANLHADEIGVEAVLSQLPPQAEVLVAIGAGTIHDLVRYCAYQRGIPFISCPTAASVDGFCSSVAAMTQNGCKKTFTAVPPALVLADLDVISCAPIQLTRSGIGDMLGKYIALADWKIANILTGEYYCSRISSMMRQAVASVTGSLVGLMDGEASAYEKLMYGLLLSGLCMQMMGNSRPASGAEHHISHLIEMQPPGIGVKSTALHGEKVGVATLMVAEEYHRFASASITEFSDYGMFTPAEIHRWFGKELGEDVLRENTRDAAEGIKATDLISCREKIAESIRSIPPVEQLLGWYTMTGMKTTLSDLGVSEDQRQILLGAAPSVRNRLTLMRLLRTMCC